MQILLRYPTVTCPGCKRPMMPSPPLPVSDDTDLSDVTYTCKNCGATTTRTIKIELGGARTH
jgi:RNase P subunit RPR2